MRVVEMGAMKRIARDRPCRAWVEHLTASVELIVGAEGSVVVDDESNGTSKVRLPEGVVEWLPTAALIDISEGSGDAGKTDVLPSVPAGSARQEKIADEVSEREKETWQWCLEMAESTKEESLELGNSLEEAAQSATTKAEELCAEAG